MKTIVPNYYNDFHCIADKCRHSCCIGWEIDIDENSLERYMNTEGFFGERLKKSISTDDCPHFKLSHDERCPFLNEKNLCDIYINLGENSLCQICSDHPRFRNYLGNYEEMGLGLCCEEASRLILNFQDKFVLPDEDIKCLEDEFDMLIAKTRKKAFEIIQNRNFSVEERVNTLISEFKLVIPQMTFAEIADFLLSLERLDEEWSIRLASLKTSPEKKRDLSTLEKAFEQLLVYFIYRHLPDAMDEIDIRAILSFAVWSYDIIGHLYLIYGGGVEELIEISRLYSSEIEYSEENMSAILNLLWDKNAAVFTMV